MRVPSEIYEDLRGISHSLGQTHQSGAPSIQDIVKVALTRFLMDWESEKRDELLEQLLESRQRSRERMGHGGGSSTPSRAQ